MMCAFAQACNLEYNARHASVGPEPACVRRERIDGAQPAGDRGMGHQPGSVREGRPFLTSQPCLERVSPKLRTAIDEFNRQEFHRCHKTLEAMWKAEPGAVRQLYKGILQVGVAFYHLQAGRPRSAIFLLQRGSVYLRPFGPHCMGIDLEHLLSRVAYCLEKIWQRGPGCLDQDGGFCIPQIRMRT